MNLNLTKKRKEKVISRKILSTRLLKTGYGTHLYDVKYTGVWEDWELINAIDNHKYDNPSKEDLKGSNYGGYVHKHYETAEITRATVGVYYD